MASFGFHLDTINLCATPMDQEVPRVKVDDLQKQRPTGPMGKHHSSNDFVGIFV